MLKKLKRLFRKKSPEAERLLELLEQYPDSFRTGLCSFIHTMRFIENSITQEEFFLLKNWLNNNHPIPKNEVYWFEIGDLQSRINYLKSKI